jgi:carbon monoxide dehydrogenase subunit G
VAIKETWSLLTDVERVAPCLPGAQLQEIEGDQFKGVVKVKVGPISVQYRGTASFVEQDEATHRLVLHGQGRDTKGQGNATADVTVTLTEHGDATNVDVRTELNVTGKVAQFGRGVMADVSDRLISQFVANLETLLESSPGEPEPAAAPEPAPAAPAVPAADLAVDPPPAPSQDPPEDPSPGATAPKDAPRPKKPKDAPRPQAVTDAPRPTALFEPNPAPGAGVRRVVSQPEPEPIDLLSTAGAPMVRRLVPVVGGVVALLVALRLRRGRSRRRRG